VVVVIPKDEDGNPVRVIGNLTIHAQEILPGGVKIPLSSWDIGAEELRRSWKSGLLGSGFQLKMPWKKLPTQDRLRLAVQLNLPDGRVFETDRDISIRPLPAMQPALDPTPPVMGGPALLPPRTSSYLD
jgi:hypothetical protein